MPSGAEKKAFNEKYRKRVATNPYSSEARNIDPNLVDRTLWRVDEQIQDSGTGSIIQSITNAVFTGPDYPSPGSAARTGRYECALALIVDRSPDPGGPPIVVPGEPRPPDWRVADIDIHGLNVGRAHRTWVEVTRANVVGRLR